MRDEVTRCGGEGHSTALPWLATPEQKALQILPLDVLKWVHNHIFGVAKRDGWVAALILSKRALLSFG